MSALLPSHVDVLIVGGGPVGALLAQSLKGSPLKVLVIEARSAVVDDPRALALSYSSRRILDHAGLWGDSLCATPIERVHISQQDTLGRVELTAAEVDLPELGCVVAYGKLAALAQQQLRSGSATLVEGATLTALAQLDHYALAEVQYQNASHSITSKLVVLADGGHFAAQLPQHTQQVKTYPQHAVLATLTPATPHLHTAWERFADSGPLALLPHGDQLALVWTQSPEQAVARIASSEADFLRELNAAIGGRAPEIIAASARSSFPLTLKTMDSVIGKRLVMIGNAAQTLHPVAGQGLNLGLRDADTLATLLNTSDSKVLGSAEQLQRYARLRSKDSRAIIHFTDGLVNLFSYEHKAIKHLRSLGLMGMDLIAPLRRGFAKRLVQGLR